MLIDPTEYLAASRKGVALLARDEVDGFGESDFARLHFLEEKGFAAARRYPAGKVFRIIGYFRDTDARLKGIDNPSATDSDLWKELIYKIMH